MAKLGGIIQVYNEANYFPYALKQAEQMCDEILIFEGCHSQWYPPRSTDGTVDMVVDSGHPYTLVGANPGIRYDAMQMNILWGGVQAMKDRGCDWFRIWDVDMFFFDTDAKRIKERIERTDKDCIRFNERRFIFNWRINTHDITGYFYRITEGMYMSPISRVHNASGDIVRDNPNLVEQMDICCHHFTQAKKLDRAKFRFQISKEKGTPGIDELWQKDVDFKIPLDLDGHKKDIEDMAGGFGANIYSGNHPEVLDGHPYRFANDIRGKL